VLEDHPAAEEDEVALLFEDAEVLACGADLDLLALCSVSAGSPFLTISAPPIFRVLLYR
jgi:hypothetical protein